MDPGPRPGVSHQKTGHDGLVDLKITERSSFRSFYPENVKQPPTPCSSFAKQNDGCYFISGCCKVTYLHLEGLIALDREYQLDPANIYKQR